MEALSPGHLLVIAIAASALFFGWRQLPDMSRSLGQSLRIFKTEIKAIAEDDTVRNAMRDTVAEARADLNDTTAALRSVPTKTEKGQSNVA
jgi:sec-independent protein translocase protein TatA